MDTDYDYIAGHYKRVKLQPYRMRVVVRASASAEVRQVMIESPLVVR